MSNHTDKENVMLNQLKAEGLIWHFGDSLVTRTTDGIKFGLGDENDTVDIEQFLRTYWDVDLNGINVTAPNVW